MTIATLRKKLNTKKIIWVKSEETDHNGRFIPDEENGTNYTIVYVPKIGIILVDNGDKLSKIKATERQYRNLFAKHGYKKESV